MVEKTTDRWGKLSVDQRKEIPLENIHNIKCMKCGNEWTPRKHPEDMTKLTCSNGDCGSQSKNKMEVTYTPPDSWVEDKDEPEEDEKADSEPEEEEQEPEPRRPREPIFQDPVEQAATAFEKFLTDTSEEMEGKISSTWIKMMVADVREYGQLPNRQMFQNILVNGKSGVSNSYEVSWVMGRYDRWMTNMQDKLALQNNQMDPSGYRNQQSGFGSAASGGNQGIPIVGAPSQQNQQQGGQWGQQPQGGQMGQQPPQGLDPATSQVVQSLQHTQQQILKHLENQNAQNQTEGGAKAQLKEFIEMKQLMEELTDDDNVDESNAAVMRLQRQMNEIASNLQQNQQQAPVEDPKYQMLMGMMQRDDVSADTLAGIASSFGVGNDPEVRKREMEIQFEREKLQQNKEKTEKYVDTLNGAIDRLGQAIGNALVGGGGSGGGSSDDVVDADFEDVQERQESSERAQDPREHADIGQEQPFDPENFQNVTETWECPNCGEESERNPSVPGVECPHCDFSIVPCVHCAEPVDVPPLGECSHLICPDCQEPVERPDEPGEPASCPSCEWEGKMSESAGEAVQCDSCEAFLPVVRPQAPSEAAD